MNPQATHIESRRFEKPDEKLEFGKHGEIAILHMRDGLSGMHAVLEPGWTWAADEKPLLGNPATCPMAHTGYCISGELVVRMVETGQETLIRAGDFFEIPPGHDGYVPGSERCQLVLFSPAEEA